MTVIIPSVVRCTILGTYYGAPTANIMDFLVSEGWSGALRPAQCQATAENLLWRFSQRVLPLLGGNYVAQQVDFVDMSQDDGATGSVTSWDDQTWPKAGSIGGQGLTGAVATLVTKQTTARRGERSGRLFLAPPTESDVDGNIIGGPYLAALNTGLATFLDELDITDGGGVNYPVVTHFTGSVVRPSSQITALVARPRVSTQRRRNR